MSKKTLSLINQANQMKSFLPKKNNSELQCNPEEDTTDSVTEQAPVLIHKNSQRKRPVEQNAESSTHHTPPSSIPRVVGGMDLPIFHPEIAFYPPRPDTAILAAELPSPQATVTINGAESTFSDYTPCLICHNHIPVTDTKSLQCSQCGGFYHQGCFVTPISVPENATWLCSATCARYYYKEETLSSPSSAVCALHFKAHLFCGLLKESRAIVVAAQPGQLQTITPSQTEGQHATDIELPTPHPTFLDRRNALLAFSQKELKQYLTRHSVAIPSRTTKAELIKQITLDVDMYTSADVYNAMGQQSAPSKRGRPRKVTPAPAPPQIATHLQVAPGVNQALCI